MVTIQNENYEFCNRINDDKDLLKSFNELATTSFGLSFDHVGGVNEPHVLVKENKVCANISVNQITFLYEGKRFNCIQLGGVMTDVNFRGRGLSRYLMEWILKQWEDKCDMIYLFANDTVLDFYPKFGFVPEDEYEWSLKEIKNSDIAIEHLDMTKTESEELLWKLYEKGNPYSRLCMIENQFIMEFYCMGFKSQNVYYIKEYDVIVVAEYDGETLVIDDIFGDNKASLTQIAAAMAIKSTKKIKFWFAPKDTSCCVSKLHKEEDTTFFVYKGTKEMFNEESKLIFPELSHT